MIDELDTFNAMATLAMARVARFPGLFSPELACEVAVEAKLDTRDHHLEGLAAQVFSPGYRPLRFLGPRRAGTMHNVYRLFWERFPLLLEPTSGRRLTVNAPPRCVKDAVEVVTDTRLGGQSSVLEPWALPEIQDFVLFSEDGLLEKDQLAVSNCMHLGSTITLVRPGERCKSWFEACKIRHDFSLLFDMLSQRVELERLHSSDPQEPIMLTIFGVKARKL